MIGVVHGVQIICFSYWTSVKYYLFCLTVPFILTICLVKRPMTLLTAMYANQKVTKTIFYVDN